MSDVHIALVTGAARRLGRSFALALARMGYGIFLHYHASQTEAQATAREIESLGVPVFGHQADLTRVEAIESMFSALDQTGHPLKVLVNSAAAMARADARTLPVEAWDAAFALNLRAAFLCAQHAARRMTAGGLIVNISDVAARKAWHVYPAYTVSKAALDSLTQVLARTLAPGVRVNGIAPGLVLPSDIVEPGQWDRMVDRLPLRRSAEPGEIASALEFLLKNEYITGQTLAVDGGYSLL